MTTLQDTPAPPPGAAAPVPLLDGSFAFYEYRGGLLIAWKRAGEEITRRKPIPKLVLDMATQVSGKTLQEVIADLLGETP